MIGDTTRLLVVIASMLLILLPSLSERLLSIKLPDGTKMAVAIALLFHVAGGINQYYWIYAPYYDKIAHCISGFALGLVLFSFFLYLAGKGIRMPLSNVYAGIILLVFCFGVFWEIIELSIDALIGSTYNLGVVDTFFDMAGNTLGSLGAVFYAKYVMQSMPSNI
ncbi:hypothetical protein FTO68_07830 [Methanocalculus taiwanensis]|uniref:DUF2238 domain-containing protein n=1 Tax=Methanocalculus taiwanensis TaxID=106207 RepID=A0ABD4TM86_9EURY|nr:hypothetical protein [Methanocalculus taiwanensis]MCQ1538889.1 hypothetical protein [Methanocalculus taiwanensis]